MTYALPTVEWKQNVAKWIVDCLEDHGVPMFRMSHIGDQPAVTGVCWGGLNRVTSVHFVDVPKDDIETIVSTTGEWRIFLKKYGNDQIKDKVHEALVVGEGESKRVIEFPHAPWEV